MKQMEAELRAWPKVELHCHLDGSISLPLFAELAKKAKVAIPANEKELRRYIEAPGDCRSLKEYLEPFKRTAFCMQRREFLEAAAFDCLRQAKEDGVIYEEIRFAPAFSSREDGTGLTMEEAIRSVIHGMKRAGEIFGIRSRLLLCMMRGRSMRENRRVIAAYEAVRSLPEGCFLGGLDLAGDEASYPPGLYGELYKEAAHAHIPMTLHAGECGLWENIEASVRAGALRIGHGIAAAKCDRTRALLKEKGIVLEMCPTSNYQTKALLPGERYPLGEFWRQGLLVTVNTDNRTVSKTTLTKEYAWLVAHERAQGYELGKRAFYEMNCSALLGAFLPGEEKKELQKLLDMGYGIGMLVPGD